MIIDILENWEHYACINKKFRKAFQFLANNNPDTIALGRTEIVPGEIYVNVREYDLQEEYETKLESHRLYVDIQYVLEGAEVIGYSLSTEAEVVDEYNQETDTIFYKGSFEKFKLNKGKFAIFFPWDSHAVRISPSGGSHVKKAVIKVLLK